MGPLGHREKVVVRVWKPTNQNHGPGGQAAYGPDQSLTLTHHVAMTALRMGSISQAGMDLPLRLIGQTILWPCLAGFRN
jgi:hypothetical protein